METGGINNIRKQVIQCLCMVFIILLATHAEAQISGRYNELKHTIYANVGFAHLTPGVNMYTLIALRECVGTKDINVLTQMLKDPDPIIIIASAHVLVDLGAAGKQEVRKRLGETITPSERSELENVLNDASSSTHRPILQYKLTKEERDEIHGCSAESH